MNILDEILKDWLPVRSARWAAGATLALTAASFGLPEFLQKFDISFAREGTLLLRVAAPLAMLLIGTLTILGFVLRYLHSLVPAESTSHGSNDITLNRAEPLLSILALVAKYHSQEIPATPRGIASDLAMDAELTLAFMWKYHNEKFFTFRNDGKKPELDTPFFLSPKAWDVIKIVEA